MPPSQAVAPAVAADRANAKVLASKKEFTWQEVAKHNTAESLWVILDEKVYDLTDFVDSHPGGREMLQLSAGRDCTDLFTMYHIFNEEKARKHITAYEIGTFVGPSELPRFAPDTRGFYATLKKRMREHYARTGRDPKDVGPGMARVLPLIALALAVFYVMHNPAVTFVPFWGKLALCLLYGVLQALPLMHWLHDCSHGALSTHESVWFGLGTFTMDWFVGASALAWMHQHIIGHHVHTNVFEADPDLPVHEVTDMRRIVPRQYGTNLYKYQHIYLPFLYGFLGWKIRVSDITDFWLRKSSGVVRVNFYNWAVLRLLSGKLIWAAWRFGVPLFVWGQSWQSLVLMALVSDAVTGFYLAYNFQVSHITEDVTWPNGVEQGVSRHGAYIPECWAENQVRTSVGYGHNDAVTAYLSGALNYQVEHHLFPGVSQYQLPELAPMVKATCAEFGLPYIYKRNFWEAFTAHVAYLYRMGQQGKAVHMD